MKKSKQSRRKRQKVSDGKQIDRLSGLPDDVLIHILSFLPTKLSVATSVLARRWRSLWAHVPILHFDCETQYSDSIMSDCETQYSDSIMSFSDIVNTVLSRLKVQTINTFRLYYVYDYLEYERDAWLATAIARNLQKLVFHYGNFSQFTLPRCIFTCETLVDLRVSGKLGNNFSDEIISLPSLKKLQLSSVRYGNYDGTLPHLLSGCPVLEELTIDGRLDEDLRCYIVSSPSIIRLVIELEFFGSSYCGKLLINAPLLRYFKLQDCWQYVELNDGSSECITPRKLIASLIEADFSFDSFRTMMGYYSYTNSVLKKIDLLCNVKYLKLSSLSLMWFGYGAFGYPSNSTVSFDNLTKLELGAHWLFLTIFLESADNLQVLILREVDVSLKHWMEPKQVPKCLLSRLTTIRIDGMGCTDRDFGMVRYLLRNAQVLKRMEIYFVLYGIDFEAKVDAQRSISSFQRGSVACELAFF